MLDSSSVVLLTTAAARATDLTTGRLVLVDAQSCADVL
jgi:hypothetical protein